MWPKIEFACGAILKNQAVQPIHITFPHQTLLAHAVMFIQGLGFEGIMIVLICLAIIKCDSPMYKLVYSIMYFARIDVLQVPYC